MTEPAAAGAARLHIDWTRCDGRGLCTELLADRLARDEWGYPLARTAVPGDRSAVPLSADELEAARDAVNLCPRQALTLVATSEALVTAAP